MTIIGLFSYLVLAINLNLILFCFALFVRLFYFQSILLCHTGNHMYDWKVTTRIFVVIANALFSL